MEKLLLCFCFTWIVFIEPNFIVAFLLIRKLGIADLPVRVNGVKILHFPGAILLMSSHW